MAVAYHIDLLTGLAPSPCLNEYTKILTVVDTRDSSFENIDFGQDAARALSREQPTTADAAVPAPANNGSADAEGVEIPAPEPSLGEQEFTSAVFFASDGGEAVRPGRGCRRGDLVLSRWAWARS